MTQANAGSYPDNRKHRDAFLARFDSVIDSIPGLIHPGVPQVPAGTFVDTKLLVRGHKALSDADRTLIAQQWAAVVSVGSELNATVCNWLAIQEQLHELLGNEQNDSERQPDDRPPESLEDALIRLGIVPLTVAVAGDDQAVEPGAVAVADDADQAVVAGEVAGPDDKTPLRLPLPALAAEPDWSADETTTRRDTRNPRTGLPVAVGQEQPAVADVVETLLSCVRAVVPDGWDGSPATALALSRAFWQWHATSGLTSSQGEELWSILHTGITPGWLPTVPTDGLSADLARVIRGHLVSDPDAHAVADELAEQGAVAVAAAGADVEVGPDLAQLVQLSAAQFAAARVGRLQWAVAAVSVVAVVLLVLAGLMTHDAENRAERADVRTQQAESKAAQFAERARAMATSPMRVELTRPNEAPKVWVIAEGEHVQIGNTSTLTVTRSVP